MRIFFRIFIFVISTLFMPLVSGAADYEFALYYTDFWNGAHKDFFWFTGDLQPDGNKITNIVGVGQYFHSNDPSPFIALDGTTSVFWIDNEYYSVPGMGIGFWGGVFYTNCHFVLQCPFSPVTVSVTPRVPLPPIIPSVAEPSFAAMLFLGMGMGMMWALLSNSPPLNVGRRTSKSLP